ncbi:MAG: TetR/AcrR family transcriptional regulator [Alphaproteobacteria bacterium]|nr:TetR/AcrR family transcriptional regulator [Alphaproteobacteria bacterium]
MNGCSFFIGLQPMPKLSAEQTEQRRNRILDAAEARFARAGFHRTSMQDICREAGISAGAFYLYFSSKEALIEGISTRVREKVLKSFAALAYSEDFGAAMAQVMQECIFEKPKAEICLWIEIGSEATRNPAVAAMLQRCDQQIFSALIELLERARTEGRINPARPINEIVQAMGFLADGMYWRRALDPSFEPASAGMIVMTLLQGLVQPVSAPALSGRERAMEAGE